MKDVPNKSSSEDYSHFVTMILILDDIICGNHWGVWQCQLIWTRVSSRSHRDDLCSTNNIYLRPIDLVPFTKHFFPHRRTVLTNSSIIWVTPTLLQKSYSLESVTLLRRVGFFCYPYRLLFAPSTWENYIYFFVTAPPTNGGHRGLPHMLVNDI